METVHYVPKGLLALTPMLAIRNADQAIAWYEKVFHAKEVYRLTEPNGKIAHAEVRINDCLLMIAEEHPDYNKSPETLGGTSIIMNLYVPDVDETVAKALDEGATMIFPVKDQFYGDRAGRIKDPFGHMWIISKHIKDVEVEELQRQVNEISN
ncbi:VOC family protein [Chryseolinea sp. H1M3-3]|uniref:VOC family protein n=1 Tax=Chryseolinea sp. H1M3-3 TaxID=3034144 RepID=UPI0023EA8A2C|nr:VOC family protein [Chryseolinea sp. H1M3-3]